MTDQRPVDVTFFAEADLPFHYPIGQDSQGNGSCDLCWPERDDQPQPLIDVSPESVTPHLAVDRPQDLEETVEEHLRFITPDKLWRAEHDPKSGLDRIKQFVESGHFVRDTGHPGAAHFQHYIRSERLIRERRDDIEEWLNEELDHAERAGCGVGQADTIHVLAAPAHWSNSEWLYLVNQVWFGGRAGVVRFNPAGGPRATFLARHNYLREVALEGQQISVHFVDDTIGRGGAFWRARTLMSVLFSKASRINSPEVPRRTIRYHAQVFKNVTVFGHCFILLDRLYDRSRTLFVNSDECYHRYLHLDPALGSQGGQCVPCRQQAVFQRIRGTCATAKVDEQLAGRVKALQVKEVAPGDEDAAGRVLDNDNVVAERAWRRLVATDTAMKFSRALLGDLKASEEAIVTVLATDAGAWLSDFTDPTGVVRPSDWRMACERFLAFLSELARPPLVEHHAVQRTTFALLMALLRRLVGPGPSPPLSPRFESLGPVVDRFESPEAVNEGLWLDLVRLVLARLAELGAPALSDPDELAVVRRAVRARLVKPGCAEDAWPDFEVYLLSLVKLALARASDTSQAFLLDCKLGKILGSETAVDGRWRWTNRGGAAAPVSGASRGTGRGPGGSPGDEARDQRCFWEWLFLENNTVALRATERLADVAIRAMTAVGRAPGQALGVDFLRTLTDRFEGRSGAQTTESADGDSGGVEQFLSSIKARLPARDFSDYDDYILGHHSRRLEQDGHIDAQGLTGPGLRAVSSLVALVCCFQRDERSATGGDRDPVFQLDYNALAAVLRRAAGAEWSDVQCLAAPHVHAGASGPSPSSSLPTEWLSLGRDGAEVRLRRLPLEPGRCCQFDPTKEAGEFCGEPADFGLDQVMVDKTPRWVATWRVADYSDWSNEFRPIVIALVFGHDASRLDALRGLRNVMMLRTLLRGNETDSSARARTAGRAPFGRYQSQLIDNQLQRQFRDRAYASSRALSHSQPAPLVALWNQSLSSTLSRRESRLGLIRILSDQAVSRLYMAALTGCFHNERLVEVSATVARRIPLIEKTTRYETGQVETEYVEIVAMARSGPKAPACLGLGPLPDPPDTGGQRQKSVVTIPCRFPKVGSDPTGEYPTGGLPGDILLSGFLQALAINPVYHGARSDVVGRRVGPDGTMKTELRCRVWFGQHYEKLRVANEVTLDTKFNLDLEVFRANECLTNQRQPSMAPERRSGVTLWTIGRILDTPQFHSRPSAEAVTDKRSGRRYFCLDLPVLRFDGWRDRPRRRATSSG